MLRLRTSSSLSLLALVIGIAGTDWLSGMTGGWNGPTTAVANTTHRQPSAHPVAARSGHWHGPVNVVQPRGAVIKHAAAPLAVAATPLQPLSTPDDNTQSWASLHGHLDGRVRMHVDTDARGDVLAARVVESSGDPILDQHALRSVRRWRFAVPPDQPQGVSGELSMRFTSGNQGLVRLP
ncbi:MAG: energy transducer TonB [Rhodanobacter sp.]